MSNETQAHNEDLAATLEEKFGEYGAHLATDASFKDSYNLDFTLIRLAGVHAHVNLGVHVTTTRDDLERVQTFAQASKRGIVMKAVYIEISEVAVNTGGLLVAFGACLSFLFDKRFSQNRSIGVRVEEDCSFQFFDIDDTIQRLERQVIDEDLAIGDVLIGRIIAYFTDKGFGFVQTDDDRKFFFHIANVVDDELRGQLPSYVLGESIPVEFQYGGNDGKKYPKAINVSLNHNSDAYDDGF